MDSYKVILALLLGVEADEALILAKVKETLEDSDRYRATLERLAEAVYHAEVLKEAPSDVKEALKQAQEVLGV